ncbi:metal-dependent phosphohydrolase [Striga asiatica]|uniref:Metal-dependent phosphohydrolase n=1 Tax=Striga asiatica TaxID=4170 RepID=A0A5A7PD06_STRAF|nr:metal-dependent phosphohydrolase [Striga asiatica]
MINMSTCGSSSIRVFSGAPVSSQRNQPRASLSRAPIIERRHYTYCRASRHKSNPVSAAISSPLAPPSIQRVGRESMGKSEIIARAEELVKSAMGGNDASHDAAHAFRVRDLALSLAREEGFSSSPDSILIFCDCCMWISSRVVNGIVVIVCLNNVLVEIISSLTFQVELAALLHDIGDYKYMRDPSEGKIVEDFLVNEGVDESIKSQILGIIKGMGFKEEVAGLAGGIQYPEFGVVQDADRLDAIGAIGIARCFTFGGSRNSVLYDPNIKPRSDLSKEKYMNKDKQTTVNHFHEKLLKLKELMKTKAGQRRAERRHKFMEEFLEEFYQEWDGRA